MLGKKQWNFQMKQYNDAVRIENQRIDAIKDIAVSSYKSQTKDLNYTVIVNRKTIINRKLTDNIGFLKDGFWLFKSLFCI